MTLDHLTGTKLCLIRYHAEQVASAASAAYWVECGQGDSLNHLRTELAKSLENLNGLMSAPAVEAVQ